MPIIHLYSSSFIQWILVFIYEFEKLALNKFASIFYVWHSNCQLHTITVESVNIICRAKLSKYLIFLSASEYSRGSMKKLGETAIQKGSCSTTKKKTKKITLIRYGTCTTIYISNKKQRLKPLCHMCIHIYQIFVQTFIPHVPSYIHHHR